MADSITAGWDLLSRIKAAAAKSGACAVSAEHASGGVPATSVLDSGVPACGSCAEADKREN